jgi:site-specific DNA-methyltransferase (adenine-specific)
METASVDVIFADPPYNLSGDGFLTCRSGRPQKCDKGVWDQGCGKIEGDAQNRV